MVGGFIGFILMASEAIAMPYSLIIMFGFMFLNFFVESVDDAFDNENKKGTIPDAQECKVNYEEK